MLYFSFLESPFREGRSFQKVYSFKSLQKEPQIPIRAFRGCGDISIIPRHPGNFQNVGAEGKLAGGTPDRDLNFQAIMMSSYKCQPQLGASWEIPAVKVLSLKGPVSLQRGWQCAPLGSTLEKTESLNRGHLPTPAKGSRDCEGLLGLGLRLGSETPAAASLHRLLTGLQV